ncbi:Pre-mRNA cleavage complex II protein Clp1-domain-containing protein [Schizophyllum commune]
MSDPAASETRQWDLHPETEYRFELDPGTTVAIKLLRGQAEIYGCELAEGKSYLFGEECKAAVFTWRGASIEMSRPSVEYTSDETPMAVYANLHIALEQLRVRALANIRGSPIPEDEGDPDATSEPPRVLILGPENSGKTSLCKMLVNYASRVAQGWAPVVANLDPAEGAFALPGAISAAAIPAAIPTCTPAATLGLSASSAPMAMAANALVPLVYWYGHPDAKRNPRLLERLIRNLGMGVSDREDAARNNVKDSATYASGFIVDTPSSFASSTTGFNEHRQRLIKAAVEAFRINVILVLGHEKLNVEMQRTYGSKLTVVKIPKSGGVVELDAAYRERVHKYQMHTYFYGHVLHPLSGVSNALLGGEAAADLVLSPSSTVIGFGDLSIYRIGAESMAPTSALSIGAVRLISEMQPVQVDPSAPGSGLLNALLAVLAPLNPDENERYDEELLDLTVSGFIAVTSIDVQNKQMTVLCPNQGSVVGRTALMGSFEWQEQ